MGVKNATQLWPFPIAYACQPAKEEATLEMALLVLAAIALLLAMAACGDTDTPATSESAPAAQVDAAPRTPEDAELRMLLASTDLSVGDNRVVFALAGGGAGPVRQPEGVRVQTYYLAPTGQEGPVETVAATYRDWDERGRAPTPCG